MRKSRTRPLEDQTGNLRAPGKARRKPEPIRYSILWAILADRELISTAKVVATAMLLKFRNNETGQCNPSYQKIAEVIGMSRDTVMDRVSDIVTAGYLVVHGTKGGSASNTNEFEFRLKPSGGAHATGVVLSTRWDCAG